MKKAKLITAFVIFIMIPATLFLGTRLKGRWYYLTSTLMVIETMLPFFLSFESRKPQARELVILAVMSALAVASRVVVVVPNFKPMTAIIMLTGIALGAEAGFMTGAISGFASNFFFSHGPWTPWQMLGYGIGGFLAGYLFHKRFPVRNPWLLAIFGFTTILLLVGPFLDLCSVFTVSARITWGFVTAVFAAGALVNLTHAAACGVTMLLFSKPLLSKLDRLIAKFGMMEG